MVCEFDSSLLPFLLTVSIVTQETTHLRFRRSMMMFPSTVESISMANDSFAMCRLSDLVWKQLCLLFASFFSRHWTTRLCCVCTLVAVPAQDVCHNMHPTSFASRLCALRVSLFLPFLFWGDCLLLVRDECFLDFLDDSVLCCIWGSMLSALPASPRVEPSKIVYIYWNSMPIRVFHAGLIGIRRTLHLHLGDCCHGQRDQHACGHTAADACQEKKGRFWMLESKVYISTHRHKCKK